jgi:hypothetical protein
VGEPAATPVIGVARREVYAVRLPSGNPGVSVSAELRGATVVLLRVRGNNPPGVVWGDARVELEDGRTLWLGELPCWTLGDL